MYMKQRLTILSLLFLLTTGLWAENVSKEKAMQIAEQFFAGNSALSKPTKVKGENLGMVRDHVMEVAYTSYLDNGKAALFVINRGNQEGFVIVSGTTETNHPVFGWSDSGSFDYENAPVQLRQMLETFAQTVKIPATPSDYANERIVQLADGRMAGQVTEGQQRLFMMPALPTTRAVQRKVESVPNVVVQPLVKVKWNQTGEYARYVDPYFESYAGVAAGCVPTAMAQLMKYWNYPARGRGFHTHNIVDAPADVDLPQLVISGQYEELKRLVKLYSHQNSVNFAESAYQWNEMGATQPATESEIDNVAKLIYDCHVACAPSKMSDGRGTGSSMSIAVQSMIRYFGYSPEVQFIACRGNENLMQQELDAGRPFLIEGGPKAGYNNDGHVFICDGYAEDDYYHFNFGWNGNGDGYYLLSGVSPNGMDFSAGQNAYIGIQPSLVAVEDGNAFVNVTPSGIGVVVGGYGDVVVPAAVNNGGQSYPVQKVNNYAFNLPRSNYDDYFEAFKKELLTSITLPEGITEIGTMAFPSTYLTEVSLPSTLKKVGVSAFFYSNILKKVSIPSIETWLNIEFEPNILESGFKQFLSNPLWSSDNTHQCRLYIGDKEATDIVIPASVKEVKPYIFCGYQFLKSVTIEEGVEKIGTSAFERVPLEELKMCSTVTEIGAKAFYKHHAQTIEIGAGLTTIGNDAFYGEMIGEYVVDEHNPKYSAYQGILYDKSRRTLIQCPNFRPGFREVKYRVSVGIPETVTTIRAHAFGNVIERLIMPSSVRNIEDEAFASSMKLKELFVYSPIPRPVTETTFHSNTTSMFNKANVHVPLGAGDAYKAAAVWGEMNIVEDLAEGSVPPEHYDYASDYNAMEIIVYKDQDGQYVRVCYDFLFDDRPVLTYSGTSMLITTDKSRYVFEHDYFVDNTMRFVRYDVPTVIEDVKTDEYHVSFRTVGNRLVVNGLKADAQVFIYNISGLLLTSAKASNDGEVSICIPDSDIVIVKTENTSFKIHTK